jgi:cystathionine beta-synthase
LNRVTKEIDALILAKGGDIQSRVNQRPNGAKMIDDAEADGRLQPGGTIIEGTSETLEWD